MNRISLPIIIVLLFYIINFVSASCNSNQININTASLEDLDKLSGIGPTKAQAIIDARPYSALEDLNRAVGIGPSTLSKIEQQGLACVETSGTASQQDTETVVTENSTTQQSATETQTNTQENTHSQIITSNTIANQEETVNQEIQPSENIINLNSDSNTVKEQIVYESKNEIIRKYAIYAFAIFLVLVIIILLIKK